MHVYKHVCNMHVQVTCTRSTSSLPTNRVCVCSTSMRMATVLVAWSGARSHVAWRPCPWPSVCLRRWRSSWGKRLDTPYALRTSLQRWEAFSPALNVRYLYHTGTLIKWLTCPDYRSVLISGYFCHTGTYQRVLNSVLISGVKQYMLVLCWDIIGCPDYEGVLITKVSWLLQRCPDCKGVLIAKASWLQRRPDCKGVLIAKVSWLQYKGEVVHIH